ncbi:MAG TPA: YlbF family regulator [Firmicutes bacterium]|nr:YlbF family regulator [Bacillota bacterium]
MDPVALARELGRALAESEEYKAYQKAKQQVEEHEAAKIMLEDFRKKQLALEKKALSGEEPSFAEVEELKRLSEILGYNPYIREYLLAEMRFTQLMIEVQKAIADSAGLDLPGFGGGKPAKAGEKEGKTAEEPARAGEKEGKGEEETSKAEESGAE